MLHITGDLQFAHHETCGFCFSRSERYSTLFCGQLDVTMRKLTYVNAGQVEPMLLRAETGKVERLSAGGPPSACFPLRSIRTGN